jgi:hypothetical protein
MKVQTRQIDNLTYVCDVTEHSIAAEAGVEKGDVVVMNNGLDFEHEDHEAALRSIAESDTVCPSSFLPLPLPKRLDPSAPARLWDFLPQSVLIVVRNFERNVVLRRGANGFGLTLLSEVDKPGLAHCSGLTFG